MTSSLVARLLLIGVAPSILAPNSPELTIVKAMQNVSLQGITTNELNILSHLLSFESNSTLYLNQRGISLSEYIRNYFGILEQYIKEKLEKKYSTAKQQERNEESIRSLEVSYGVYQAGLKKLSKHVEETIRSELTDSDYKFLHSLCDAINRSLYYVDLLNLEIFIKHKPLEWVDEILTNVLLQAAGQMNDEELDQFTLSIFQERLNSLELFEREKQESIGVEATDISQKKSLILIELLSKQKLYDYSLTDINNLIGYSVSNHQHSIVVNIPPSLSQEQIVTELSGNKLIISGLKVEFKEAVLVPSGMTIIAKELDDGMFRVKLRRINYDLLGLLKKDNFWVEIQSRWLKDKLFLVKEINTKSLEDIIELTSLTMKYSYYILNNFLNTVNNKQNSYEKIKEFFQNVDNTILTLDEKEQFLSGLDSKYIQDNFNKLNCVQVQKLMSKLQGVSESLKNTVAEKLSVLLSNGWCIKSLRIILSKVVDETSLIGINHVLTTICDFALREYDTNIKEKILIDILAGRDLEECAALVHKLAIEKTFGIGKEKEIEELVEELEKLNNDLKYTKASNILAEYKKVMDTYKGRTNSVGNEIEFWGTQEIQEWTDLVKSKNVLPDLYEKCAVIKRAVELSSKEKGKELSPRAIQVISVLVMLNGEKDQGRLAQINTGEGKTTIVAMLAAYKALEGHKIDIVTSSPELAKPQSVQQKSFFDKFGLSVAHNGKDDVLDIKERYKADIVYGAVGDFQGDILRDEYSRLGTRSGRVCDVAIVDEVDSMFIDGKNHIVMLSSPMPAMDYLESVLCTIWQQINSCADSIKTIEGKAYLVDKTSGIDEEGKACMVEETMLPIEGTKENFIKNTTERYIRKLLRDDDLDDQEFFDEVLFERKKEEEVGKKSDDQLKQDVIEKVKRDFPKLVIPIHLREFVLKAQLPRWIDSAIHAKYKSKLNQHYILKDGNKIVPVDATNTGIIQANMNWSNGLHQFLQIKHGCKITAENVSTNFISNVSYFKRYGSSIYGMTGTLGSNEARELLHETYQVDSVIVPTFKQRQHKELVSIVKNNKDNWYNNIIDSNISKLKNGRAVLIITKYIGEIYEIKRRFLAKDYDAKKIKIYKTENDSKIVEEELKSGEIIIATNIAGRGTDIIPSANVEKNGGLHVCITFMPPNKRVEQQNIGRTSRTGNKGTSQFIILDQASTDIEQIRFLRNIQEEISLEKAKTEILKVVTKDEIFKQFCTMLNTINPTRGKRDNITLEEKLQINYIKSIEEKFGLWLQIQDKEIVNKTIELGSSSEALNLFAKFKEEMLSLLSKLKSDSDASINPVFYVLNGNILLQNKEYDRAEKEYGKAINLDKYFAANAYYNRGFTRIAAYVNTKKKSNYYEPKEDFKEARRIIEEHLEPMLYIIQRSVMLNSGDGGTPVLSDQVQHKLYLYTMQKNAINIAIGIGKERYNAQIQEIKDKLVNLNGNDLNAANDHLNFLEKNKAQQIKGEIGKIQDNNREMKIEFDDIYKAFPEDEDVNLYNDEIEEYKKNGFEGILKITEVVPINWGAVVGVALIGLGQLIGGAALTVFTLGAGSSIGMGLISEGVSDLITAVKDGIINRDFSWSQWGIQKVISMAVSLVCAGMGAIKDAAKTAGAGIKSIVSKGAKALTTSIKNGWKLAAKAMGTALAKGIAKECVNQLVDAGISQLAMPAIESSITDAIEPKIQEALCSNLNVKKMLELDSHNQNKYYQNAIKNIAMQLIHKDTGIGKQIFSYLRQFAEGVISGKTAASRNKCVQLVAHAGTVVGISEAIAELVKSLPEFIAELNKKIDELAAKDNLNKDQDVSTKTDIAAQEKIVEISGSVNTIEGDIEDQIGSEDTKISEKKAVQEKLNYTPKEVISALSVSVATNMSNIIKGRILKPVTTMAVSYGIEQLSKDIDKTQQQEIGIYQASRRIEFASNMYRMPERIQRLADDLGAKEKTNSIIQELEKGGEAGLPHMSTISDEVNKPIKVFDKKGKLLTVIGEEKGGKAIEVRYEEANERHYTLNKKDANGQYIQTEVSGKNNCLFDVVASQLDKDHPLKGNGELLRKSIVARLETQEGRRNIAMVALDIEKLENYNKSSLIMGGASRYNMRSNDKRNDNKTKDMTIEKAITQHYYDGEMDFHTLLRRTAVLQLSGIELYAEKGTTLQINKGSASDGTAAAHTIGFNVGIHNTTDEKEKKVVSIFHLTAKTNIIPSYINNNIEFDRGRDKIGLDVYTKFLDTGAKISHIDYYYKQYEKQLLAHLQRDPKKSPVDNNKLRQAAVEGLMNAQHEQKKVIVLKGQNSKQESMNTKPLKGLCHLQLIPVNYINLYFTQYTLGGIQDILELRLMNGDVGLSNVKTLSQYYIWHYKYGNIEKMLFDVQNARSNKPRTIILATVSLYGQHAVGFMFIYQGGYKFSNNTMLTEHSSIPGSMVCYIDPSNEPIPPLLAQIFADYGYPAVVQLPVEQQRYSNCGPEVIENFIYYLTGTRATQEATVYVHSLLLENALLNPIEYTVKISENNKLIKFLSNQVLLVDRPIEQKEYSNCGPEVIENFMLYLTGERLSQEDAIVYNSRLVEQELMVNAGNSGTKHFSKIDFSTVHGSYFMHILVGHREYVSECEFVPDVRDTQSNQVIELQQEEEAKLIDGDTATEKSIVILPSKQERTVSSDEVVTIDHCNGDDKLNLRATECLHATDRVADDKIELVNKVILQQDIKLINSPIKQAREIVASKQEKNINIAEPVTSNRENGNKLYLRATELAEEGWLAEGSKDENAALIAESRFAEAMQLYAEVISLDPTNIMYRQAFNIISLKIDGNSLFNEGVELADLAYQLEEELLFKEGRNTQEYDIIIGKYLDVINIYQAAHDKFTEGLRLSLDMRFKSCMELVKQSINNIQMAFEQLEDEKQGIEALVDDVVENSEDEPFIELFANNNEHGLMEGVLMGINHPVDYHLIM